MFFLFHLQVKWRLQSNWGNRNKTLNSDMDTCKLIWRTCWYSATYANVRAIKQHDHPINQNTSCSSKSFVRLAWTEGFEIFPVTLRSNYTPCAASMLVSTNFPAAFSDNMLHGGTVVQRFALSPRSENFLGWLPGQGVSVRSSLVSLQVFRLLPQSKNM